MVPAHATSYVERQSDPKKGYVSGTYHRMLKTGPSRPWVDLKCVKKIAEQGKTLRLRPVAIGDVTSRGKGGPRTKTKILWMEKEAYCWGDAMRM